MSMPTFKASVSGNPRRTIEELGKWLVFHYGLQAADVVRKEASWRLLDAAQQARVLEAINTQLVLVQRHLGI